MIQYYQLNLSSESGPVPLIIRLRPSKNLLFTRSALGGRVKTPGPKSNNNGLVAPQRRFVIRPLATVLLTVIVTAGVFLPLDFAWHPSFADTNWASGVTGAATVAQSNSGQLPLAGGLGERYILVSLADQHLVAYENGGKVFEAIISSGSRRAPTPRGHFTVLNKAPRTYSKVAGLYLPYWMAFTRYNGYWLGFHELPESPDGTKEGAEHLGHPYSGGCIRLGMGDAKVFYDWAQVGDKVLIY